MTELPDELKDQSTNQPISILRTPQPFIQSPTKFLEHTDVPLVSTFVLLGFGLFILFQKEKKMINRVRTGLKSTCIYRTVLKSP